MNPWVFVSKYFVHHVVLFCLSKHIEELSNNWWGHIWLPFVWPGRCNALEVKTCLTKIRRYKANQKDSILLSTHIIVIFLCHYITRKCSNFLFCKANQLWHVLFMNYCRFFLFSLRIQWSWGKKGLQSNKKFNHQLKNYMKIDHSFMSWRDLLNDLSLCEE